MKIEIPAELGEKVYHLEKIRYKKRREGKSFEYVIIECTVDAVHIGRKLKGIGNTYIRLRATNTGYMHTAISLQEFENNCFRSYKEALETMKERSW